MATNVEPVRHVPAYLASLDGRGVEAAARLALAGGYPSEVWDGDATTFKHGMLRWAVAADPAAGLQWRTICRNSRDPRLRERDRYVEAFWRSIWSDPKQDDLRRFIAERWAAREDYERALFRWFLARFNVAAALRIAGARRSAAVVSLSLPAAAIAVVAAVFGGAGVSLGPGLFAFAGLFALIGLGWPLVGVRLEPYLQALVPRLAAAVGIGYLFLAAAPELVAFVFGWRRPEPLQWTAAGCLLLAIWTYLVLHIARRVEPPPRPAALAGRALRLILVGAMHAAAGLALSAPLLTSPRFLGGSAAAPTRPVSLVLLAVVALGLGVVLQLAWEENPLTDPL